MKKKIVYTIIITLCLVSLYYISSNNYISIDSFSIMNIHNENINDKLITEFTEGEEEIKKNAAASIIKACLQDLQYENWLDYQDYIDLKVYHGNITPGIGDELVVALNLSKDISVVCTYKKEGDIYKLHNKIENLLPIQDIKFIKVPTKHYDMIAIYQVNDERIGGFYYEKFLEIYLFTNNKFEKLLKETLYSEEIYRTKWINDTVSVDNWVKNIKKSKIHFIIDPSLMISIGVESKKYTAPGSQEIPGIAAFKLDHSDSYTYNYFWNEEFDNFSLSEETYSFMDTDVIIVDDSNLKTYTDYSSMYNKYKVLTSSGKTIYVNKNDIIKKK